MWGVAVLAWRSISLHFLLLMMYPHDAICDSPSTPQYSSFTFCRFSFRLLQRFVAVASHLVVAFYMSFVWFIVHMVSIVWQHNIVDGTRFDIQSSSLVTLCRRTLCTLYRPDVRCSTLSYRRRAISSTASEGIVANWRQSTNSYPPPLNVSSCRPFLLKSPSLCRVGLWTIGLRSGFHELDTRYKLMCHKL